MLASNCKKVDVRLVIVGQHLLDFIGIYSPANFDVEI